MKGAWHVASAVFVKELTDALRDRRTLLMVLVSTVLVGPLVLLALSALVASQEQRAEQREVYIDGLEHAPSLTNFLERQTYVVKPAPAGYEQALRDSKFGDPVLVVDADFEAGLVRGEPPRVTVVSDAANRQAEAGSGRLLRLITAFGHERAALNLALRGIAPELSEPVQVEERDLASTQARASALTGMVPFFVMIAVLYGALNAALDTTAGERERGSLEPLLINPVTRAQVVVGKWAAVVMVSWGALLVALVGFSLALQRAPLQELGIRAELGGMTSLKLVLVLLPLSLFAAALQMLLSLFARTFKEAQTYLQLMMIVPMIPGMMLSLSPIEAKAWMMCIPMFAQTLLLNDVLRGTPAVPGYHVLAVVFTALAAAVTVGIAVWMLGKEKIVFGRGAGT